MPLDCVVALIDDFQTVREQGLNRAGAPDWASRRPATGATALRRLGRSEHECREGKS